MPSTLVQNYREELKQLIPYWKHFGPKAKLQFYHNSKDETIVIKFIGKITNQTIWAVPVGDQYCLQDCGELCKWLDKHPDPLPLLIELQQNCDTLGIKRVFNLLYRVIDKPLHIQQLIVFADDVGRLKEMLDE